jgi:hypothetical protein
MTTLDKLSTQQQMKHTADYALATSQPQNASAAPTMFSQSRPKIIRARLVEIGSNAVTEQGNNE